MDKAAPETRTIVPMAVHGTVWLEMKPVAGAHAPFEKTAMLCVDEFRDGCVVSLILKA